MRILRTSILGLSAGLALSLASTAGAQDNITLRMSTPASETDQRSIALAEVFAPAVAEFATYEPHYNASLVAQGAELEAIASGDLEMSIASAQELATFFPEFSIFATGYVHQDAEHQVKVFNDPLMDPFKQKVEDELGVKLLAVMYLGRRHVNLRQTSGPVLERPGDLAAILTNLEPNDVLFVDEIHRLSPVVEEVLYPAMEDFQLDIMIGEGPAARSIKLDLPPFTLVGATTRAGLLTSPLRDRFGIVQRLEFYSESELHEIACRSAGILNLPIEDDGARQIAGRARGTPRIVNRLLRRVRDFAEVEAEGVVTETVAINAMDMLEVDPHGFDSMDRRLLHTIIDKFDGGPVGIESLSAALGEERGTIEDVLEPYLIQQGFMMRTARGRVATSNAYQHFGLAPPVRDGTPELPMFDKP